MYCKLQQAGKDQDGNIGMIALGHSIRFQICIYICIQTNQFILIDDEIRRISMEHSIRFEISIHIRIETD